MSMISKHSSFWLCQFFSINKKINIIQAGNWTREKPCRGNFCCSWFFFDTLWFSIFSPVTWAFFIIVFSFARFLVVSCNSFWTVRTFTFWSWWLFGRKSVCLKVILMALLTISYRLNDRWGCFLKDFGEFGQNLCFTCRVWIWKWLSLRF